LARVIRARPGVAHGQGADIFHKPYDMKRLLPLAETVAEQAVSTMKEWIEAPHGGRAGADRKRPVRTPAQLTPLQTAPRQ